MSERTAPTIHEVVQHLQANPDWVDRLGAFQIAEIERRMKQCISCIIAQAGTCEHLAERRQNAEIDRMHIRGSVLGVFGEARHKAGLPASFTPIEVCLVEAFWKAGLHPELQHTIGPYTVDFAFTERRVVVEADGRAYHQDTDREERRDAYLRRSGWHPLHFSGSQITFDADAIVDHIYDLVRP